MIRTITGDKMHNALKARTIQQGGPLTGTPPHMKRAASKYRERHVIEDILLKFNKLA
ncbi:hypothetical protein KIF53_15545 [Chromobacterium subtsugae]|uniref:Transposase n=1 Tax=Chromobacterium subtsugae TaxID=251747 RepID=A0ABS7FG58_9NEIS|nr:MULTISPECIES: hypothetical protein [Chromobacterium]MBW7567820.1 hypothetical protein [Chromobacterium subtsugae]MBW8289047.1 hypothetical protein [Chromobacterium subtsugae]WSE93809.1 hypothetical protein U6115_11355 [Chromobacterium subtsugae]WVH62186.1 hypothetical protein U6151_11375 [Chromobacterium subtsugae]